MKLLLNQLSVGLPRFETGKNTTCSVKYQLYRAYLINENISGNRITFKMGFLCNLIDFWSTHCPFPVLSKYRNRNK